MAIGLPDEIVSEILTPVLRVPDHVFSDTSTGTSPFATYQESTSAILLVCKAWLRVSTPLLYHVVVLRSKAQVKALDATLKTNPDLGRFIKKLRVEGGFGSCMRGILQNAPHITVIFLSLHIHASDSPSGLVLGLPLVNPQRVIIWDRDEHPLKNKHVGELMKAVELSAKKKWSNMTTIVFPYTGVTQNRNSFVMAMSSIPTVTTVSFPVWKNMYTCLLPRHIHDIAQKASIQTIEIRVAITPTQAESHFDRPEHSLLMPKLRFTDIRPEVLSRKSPPKVAVARPVDPSFRPMASSPQTTVDLIWKHVLFFAMKDVLDADRGLHSNLIFLRRLHRTLNQRQLQYVLVSKTFHRLALQYLYRWPVFSTSQSLQNFRRTLAKNPSLGLHMREPTCYLTLSSPTLTDEIQTALFVHTPHLTRLVLDGGVRMDWGVFRTLAECTGASLVELSVCVSPQKDASGDLDPDPAVFYRFTALRSLVWSYSTVKFSSDAKVSGVLPALEFLHLRSESLYPILTALELPSIRRAKLCGDAEAHSFLAAHGKKIRELTMFRPTFNKVVALCPNLCNFDIRLGTPTGEPHPYKVFAQTWSYQPQHHVLTRLALDKYPQDRKADEDAEWDMILSPLEPSHLPALCELQVLQCKWPAANEHAIAQSGWVKRAEKLWKRGIKLMDKDGVHWRPRLKT
ncbi:hypothetical protein DFH09DRAFT_1174702 [Mycena vulgaris]|nr:hypothetical protein DFH09DRAFT_1174702 [Mycena vulgaris]